MNKTLTYPLLLLSILSLYSCDKPKDNTTHSLHALQEIVELTHKEKYTHLVLDVNGTIASQDHNYQLLNNSREIVHKIQSSGIPVYCLTDTHPGEVPQADMVSALRDNGVILSEITNADTIKKIEALGSSYLNGIIYAGPTATKGLIIATLFSKDDKVAFVDDTKKHIISANEETKKAGINCSAYLLLKK